MNTITCPGCKATAEHDCGGHLAGIAKATGYNSVMLHTCEFLYVCPTCMAKVDKAIAILREVFPDGNDLRNVYMLHLMRPNQQKETPWATTNADRAKPSTTNKSPL